MIFQSAGRIVDKTLMDGRDIYLNRQAKKRSSYSLQCESRDRIDRRVLGSSVQVEQDLIGKLSLFDFGTLYPRFLLVKLEVF